MVVGGGVVMMQEGGVQLAWVSAPVSPITRRMYLHQISDVMVSQVNIMVIRLPELRVTRHGVAVYVVLYPLLEGSLDGSGEGALVVGDVVVVQHEVV